MWPWQSLLNLRPCGNGWCPGETVSFCPVSIPGHPLSIGEGRQSWKSPSSSDLQHEQLNLVSLIWGTFKWVRNASIDAVIHIYLFSYSISIHSEQFSPIFIQSQESVSKWSQARHNTWELQEAFYRLKGGWCLKWPKIIQKSKRYL